MGSGLIFFLSLVAVVTSQTSCPEGYTNFGTSCYSFYKIKASFSEAVEYCQNFGGSRLAEIETKLENTQLKNFLSSQNTDGVNGVWLGGSDKLIEGMFTWDKTGTSFSFADWAKGQPDDNNVRTQDCLAMFKTFNFQWGDHYCNEKLAFLCEKPVQ